MHYSRGVMKKVWAILLLATMSVSAQQYVLKGFVYNKITGEPLSYSSIRIEGTARGTTSNSEGAYEFRLNKGNYRFIASYIGFASDTISVSLNTDKKADFKLDPKGVNLAEVTVLPEDNPANEVIRRAIIAKNERNKYLNDYSFRAYTKGLIKTTKDFNAKGRRLTASISEKDTAQLKITGIIENESMGYFKKPDKYKDEIIARKQTANTPSQINVFTGGRIIQNFYTDDIEFMGRPLTSPIADEALDFYYYKIIDTVSIDRINVFKIHFSPLRESDPGFVGDIYIADNIFALVKVDVSLNKAANFAGIFEKTRIFQQFYAYADDIYMPVDYRVFVEGNALGIFKFGFELNTQFSDYTINRGIPDDFFGMAVVKVLPGADKKDSTYWKNSQAIPNTLDEVDAYKRIDSLEAVPVTFWDRFSFLSTSVDLNDNISITGPLGLYDFNKVEGHVMQFNVNAVNLMDERMRGGINLRYGFDDKKFKGAFSSSILLGEYRTGMAGFEIYNKANTLFSESDRYSDLTSTFMNLFLKEDFRDYYYSKGIKLTAASDIMQVLRGSLSFVNRTDNTAVNNTEFSIFRRDWKFNPNIPIYNSRVNALQFTLSLDYRNYIEDGYRRMRLFNNNFNFFLNGRAFISSSKFLNSGEDFGIYELNMSGNLRAYKTAFLNYSFKGIYSDKAVPFQFLYNLPGNINGVSKDYSFRTLRMTESFGDRGATAHFLLNFGDEFFRLLNVPLLKDWQLLFSLHANAGWIDLKDNSKVPAAVKSNLFTKPLIEAGFGIGQMLFPFRVEFTWRLTHRNENSFIISLNSITF